MGISIVLGVLGAFFIGALIDHFWGAIVIKALEADRDKFKGEVEHLAKLPAEEFAAWQARFHAVKTRLEAKL